MREDFNWMDRGTCGTEDPDMWTADRPSKAIREHQQRTCAKCPVRTNCAAFAAENWADSGTFAGRFLTKQSGQQAWIDILNDLRRIAGLPLITDEALASAGIRVIKRTTKQGVDVGEAQIVPLPVSIDSVDEAVAS